MTSIQVLPGKCSEMPGPIKDISGKIAEINQGIEKLYGWPATGLRGYKYSPKATRLVVNRMNWIVMAHMVDNRPGARAKVRCRSPELDCQLVVAQGPQELKTDRTCGVCRYVPLLA